MNQALLLPDVDAPERVGAKALSDGRWLIMDIPCFSSHVGFLDVVLAHVDSVNGLTFTSVLEPSTWSTFAVLLRDLDTTRIARMLLSLEKKGCHLMSRNTRSGGAYVSVAVSPGSFQEVEEILENGHKESLWIAGPLLERKIFTVA